MLATHLDARDGMSASEEGVLTQAAHFAFAGRGIIAHDPDTFDRRPPTLDDLFRGIDVIAAGGLQTAADDGLLGAEEHTQFRAFSSVEADDGTSPALDLSETLLAPTDRERELASRLRPKFLSFAPGGVNHNLVGQTNIDLDSRLVVVDLGAVADTGELPLVLHAMLAWAYAEAKRSQNRFDVSFDEAHYLLGRPATRDLINLFVRHARHYEAGLTLMSQTAHEFVREPETREIYENCDVKCLFYAESVSEATVDYFDLSEAEVEFVQSAARGQDTEFSECLLATSVHGRRRLEVRSGPFEHRVVDGDDTARELHRRARTLLAGTESPGEPSGESSREQSPVDGSLEDQLPVDNSLEDQPLVDDSPESQSLADDPPGEAP
jgi:hypothetical protein